ncbi:glycosyltransferase family 2 protein [Curtobacterium sp. PhB136]|uniref:glycosyltransferase family 2 protein n=1 Tax=Curtobacterium sp. PhB136 TaxID=2485181 RepID=UPI0010487DF1|nr:glycosyltransferase family 2 protein [Curtobacterium sp. PhB136]TCK62990.1 glycosyl transferase family 2 [Curtobacterium sp. PhB136]
MISVVVPAHDAAPWIEQTLESIQAQAVRAWEVIVVENGSGDRTAPIVSALAAKDDRIRLVRSNATTAAAARNEGIALATGEYLVFADSDDLVPDGAYSAMLASLEASGSDMVIGDHLKFSPTATWSPTKRWYPFDAARTGLAPDEVPELLSGRACWNRMFRRSFWDRAELRFPEIPSVDDIEPMTRAFVAAETIDVIPDCVYLYRDRGDTSSLSLRDDADTTIRYLEQELRCAELVQDRAALRRAHAEVVLDADGWAHLSRFLATAPDEAAIGTVSAAFDDLVAVIPIDGIDAVAPVRRALWMLVLAGRWTEAGAFVRGSRSDDAAGRLDTWIQAVLTAGTSQAHGADVGLLVEQGLVPALINDADAVPEAWLAERVEALASLPFGARDAAEPGLRAAMVDALRRGDTKSVAEVSRLRRFVPLVVSRVEPTAEGLELSGTLTGDVDVPTVSIVLHAGGIQSTAPIRAGEAPRADGSRAWSARISADGLDDGRYTVSVRGERSSELLPVVTARMPLPPLDAEFPLQPLADRKNGWRFLVDRRRPPRRGLAGVLGRVGRRLR